MEGKRDWTALDSKYGRSVTKDLYFILKGIIELQLENAELKKKVADSEQTASI